MDNVLQMADFIGWPVKTTILITEHCPRDEIIVSTSDRDFMDNTIRVCLERRVTEDLSGWERLCAYQGARSYLEALVAGVLKLPDPIQPFAHLLRKEENVRRHAMGDDT